MKRNIEPHSHWYRRLAVPPSLLAQANEVDE
jgi:hypothetical protein